MALKRKYVHTQNTLVDSTGNETVIFEKNTVRDVTTSEKSSVTIEGKLLFSGTCSTAANTAAKTVNIPGFALVDGAHMTVLFSHEISTAGSTLSVNNMRAYPIKLNGAALKAGIIRANNFVVLRFDGSSFQVVGGAGSIRVSQNDTSKLYLMGVPEIIDGSPSDIYLNSRVSIDEAGARLNAPKFKGDGSEISNINATNIKTGILNASRLPNSGVTAGSYGSSNSTVLGFGDTITIPYITVDIAGRVTNASAVNLTLPSNPDTDTKVTHGVATTTPFYLVGAVESSTATGTLLKDTGIYTDGTPGRLIVSQLLTSIVRFDNESYITKTKYTGTAAAVSSITTHIRDNLTGNGVTNNALSANQGYQMNVRLSNVEAAIAAINNSIAEINSKLGTQVTFSLSGDVLTITPK